MAIDVIARALASQGGGASGAVNSVNGKTGNVILDYTDVGATASVFITSTQNITVNGYSVPKLTDEQIISAYNSFIVGNEIIIVDKDGNMHFKVTQADIISDEVCISYVYFDLMILTYFVNNIVEFSITNPIGYSGYDSTKTQTLKNLNGQITWVTDTLSWKVE